MFSLSWLRADQNQTVCVRSTGPSVCRDQMFTLNAFKDILQVNIKVSSHV